MERKSRLRAAFSFRSNTPSILRQNAALMLHLLRHWLLALFLLLAQSGAMTHGLSHALDADSGNQPACEQCLAYAPMGAAAPSTPSAWSAPAQAIPFDAAVPMASLPRFLARYRSRAPPRLNG